MFARIGVMRALNRHVEQVFDPKRKVHHWGQEKAGQGIVRFARSHCAPGGCGIIL